MADLNDIRAILNDIRAILFDMDGTLVDSDRAVERSWLAWAAEYGADGPAAYRMAHGSPSETTVRKLLSHLGDDEIRRAAARQLELQYDDLADVMATPGALELIATLDRLGLPWAVVTSADERLAKARLTAAGITPRVLVTTDDVPAGKPDPAGYLLAARMLGVPAENCLVVEDAEVGLEAARAAGAHTAALRGLSGDVRLRGLADLTAMITQAGRPGTRR
ncbi:MAG TPA: HAD-IA family hydrolase [Actinoplanes sp.]|nr:HAD-IA family hydrolase [Actinoplanes sp.]